MTLRQNLNSELTRLKGLTSASPTEVTVVGPAGISLQVDFLAVDSIGCSFQQVVLHAPAVSGATIDVLKQWADGLSRRITYLLENIGPLEYDAGAGEVLIRSSPPDPLPDGTQYYEVLLQSHSGGRFALRRYQSTKGQPGRSQVAMTTTHEVLLKLADDLVQTIPAAKP